MVQGLKDSKAVIELSSLTSEASVGTEAAPPSGGMGGGGGGGGGGSDPSCMDRKYLVAACRSCSLSSAVCRLEDQLIAC